MLRLLAAYKQAFRFWLRQRTRPLTIEEAEERKLFWAKSYMVCGICIIGVLTFNVFKKERKFPPGGNTWYDSTTAFSTVRADEIRVIGFKGFTKVADFYYSKKDMDKSGKTPSVPEEDKSNDCTIK